jgi:hypothetical protein
MYSSKAGVPWSGTALATVAKVMAVTTAASRGPYRFRHLLTPFDSL